MSLKAYLKIVIGISILNMSMPSVAEYAEGALGYDWNPETKQFKRVFREWQEGIVLDRDSGNYFITYKDGYGEYNEVIFEPATKIDPFVQSKIRYISRDGKIVCEYNVKNGPEAKQSIRTLVAFVSNVSSSVIAPSGWEGSVVPTVTDSSLRVVWAPDIDTGKGLPPEANVRGFKIESNDLPGLATMQIKGNAKQTTWPGHSPDIATSVGKQVTELEAKDFIVRIIAVPKIFVPNPYSTAAVLTNLQKHIKNDILTMSLIDPTFLAQLDRSLQAAIDAAKINNTVGIKQNLYDVRKALKKAHHDVDENKDDDDAEHEDSAKKLKSILIDKLAARVIDFDVKYVLKRLEKVAEE